MFHARRAALRTLHVDRVALEVVESLARAGVRAIFLKGFSWARLLYSDGAPRRYTDVDLLVGPSDWMRAEAAVAELGFAKVMDSEDVGTAIHASTWRRDSDMAYVDLHRTLPGVTADAERHWRVVSGETATAALFGRDVEVLTPAASAFLVAAHAAHHGVAVAKPMEDLRRAIEQLDLETWSAAAVLARELGGLPALSTGLRLLLEGQALAEKLGVEPVTSVELAIRSRTPGPGAFAYQLLAETPGLGRKIAVVARKLAPSRRFMQGKYKLARRGNAGLAAAYALRLLLLVRGAPRGFALWRTALRESRAHGSDGAVPCRLEGRQPQSGGRGSK